MNCQTNLCGCPKGTERRWGHSASPHPIVGTWLHLTSHCLGSVTGALNAQHPRAFLFCVPQPCSLTQAWFTKPLPTAGLSTPLPGNWYLFLACVGSLLSTAADGLYLADFNELRVADIRLGSTFLACVRMSMLGMVCSSACVPVHLCVCIRCRSMHWCIH